MDEDIKPKPHKVIIIYDGERPYCAAFIDKEQEKKIMDILFEKRRKWAN